MKKFIVLYYAPKDLMEKMKHNDPEEMKKGMELWMVWKERCGSGLVELGAPLGNGQKMTKEGGMPSNRDVTGYSVLQAEDMEGAQKMLEGHPHLEWNEACEIEVYEMMPLPGM